MMSCAAALPADLETRFDVAGVAMVEHALDRHDLLAMDRAFPDLAHGSGGARSAAFRPDDFGWLAGHEGLLELGKRLGRGPMVLMRALALDKSPEANWFVPWHQDRADETRERCAQALARMVTLRVHLDDCGEDNGPLEVLPGSHLAGRLDRAAIADLSARAMPLLCLAVRGDILAMRPLLVHRSQRARSPRRRRVLHLEYAPAGE
jgi:hypothetical protein